MSDYRDANRPRAFRWLKAVFADRALTTTRDTAVAMFDAASLNGTGARPGVAGITEYTGASSPTVKRHQKVLRDAGFLTVVRRGGGYKSKGSATVYALTFPVGHPADVEAASGVTWVTPQPTFRGHPGDPSTLQGSPDEPSEVTQVTPALDLQGSNPAPSGITQVIPYRVSGLKEGGVRLAHPLPPAGNLDPSNPRCERHMNVPDGDPGPPCVNCQRVRRWLEDEPARAARQRADTAAGVRAAVAACPACDELGWLLDTERIPVEPAVRCSHRKTSGPTGRPRSHADGPTPSNRHPGAPEPPSGPQIGTQAASDVDVAQADVPSPGGESLSASWNHGALPKGH